jgi:hypothetical protein
MPLGTSNGANQYTSAPYSTRHPTDQARVMERTAAEPSACTTVLHVDIEFLFAYATPRHHRHKKNTNLDSSSHRLSINNLHPGPSNEPVPSESKPLVPSLGTLPRVTDAPEERPLDLMGAVSLLFTFGFWQHKRGAKAHHRSHSHRTIAGDLLCKSCHLSAEEATWSPIRRSWRPTVYKRSSQLAQRFTHGRTRPSSCYASAGREKSLGAGYILRRGPLHIDGPSSY